MPKLRDRLEIHQVSIYSAAIFIAVLCAFAIPNSGGLEPLINPTLAFMLFVTFLQVPISELRRAFTRVRFLGALLCANFLAIPLVISGLVPFLPEDPMVRLGVLLVLLTPCIDYVVTFSHLGRADAKLLLAATPALLLLQMALLPLYLNMFMGKASAKLIRVGPFVEAFAWLIVVPLVLAGLVQAWAARSTMGSRVAGGLGLAPVPATALVLFVVVAAVIPQLGNAIDSAVRVIPVYIAFAAIAPVVGWIIAKGFGLEAPAGRSIAFSAATRNSLVVLPLALAVPGAVPLLPAIIVTQTIVELVSELVYVRLIPKLGRSQAPRHAG
ncbi:arsenic resistance protein [Achromobacter spanius]|uniref:Arsenic resistance protein n=1 Tax=Achromobacter spanius TaxID=217203 RepID=A0AAW3HZ41_9BURK|nr:arsenic resistance protein [Achromobacter spanius]KNE25810.1 arsenic resistance protein [Achromobacter spanius]